MRLGPDRAGPGAWDWEKGAQLLDTSPGDSPIGWDCLLTPRPNGCPLFLFGLQALKVQAESDEQGNRKLTKNHARRYFSTDKDDFHDGARNAYIPFRFWLLDCDAG